MEGRFLRRGHHMKNVQAARAHAALRRCSTRPSRAPTERPSLSHTTRPRKHRQNALVTHTTRPILRSAAGSRNSNLRPVYKQENAAGAASLSRPWGVQLQVAAFTTHAVHLAHPAGHRPWLLQVRQATVYHLHQSLVETSTFNSSTTKESVQIRHRLTCQSSDIVYRLYCDTCQQSSNIVYRLYSDTCQQSSNIVYRLYSDTCQQSSNIVYRLYCDTG